MDKSASQISANDILYPSIGPFDTRMLNVGGGHRIYFEQCGNPKGHPVIVLHGGPGGGCSPAMRRFFDPQHYRIILFDQRGCGRSKPHADVTNNTTWDLVADIEKIRTVLGIESWDVFGGSWGATLSLIYAQKHPARVNFLALRGVFLMTGDELDWFYGGGAGNFWPEAWQVFVDMIPPDERFDLIAAYHKRLFSGHHETELKYGRVWSNWESATATLKPRAAQGKAPSEYARAFARLENHYFVNKGFLDERTHILNNMQKIEHIAGAIVQGRYDMICPPKSAVALAAKWPNVSLHLLDDAGHALSEPSITKTLVDTMDSLAQSRV